MHMYLCANDVLIRHIWQIYAAQLTCRMPHWKTAIDLVKHQSPRKRVSFKGNAGNSSVMKLIDYFFRFTHQFIIIENLPEGTSTRVNGKQSDLAITDANEFAVIWLPIRTI